MSRTRKKWKQIFVLGILLSLILNFRTIFLSSDPISGRYPCRNIKKGGVIIFSHIIKHLNDCRKVSQLRMMNVATLREAHIYLLSGLRYVFLLFSVEIFQTIDRDEQWCACACNNKLTRKSKKRFRGFERAPRTLEKNCFSLMREQWHTVQLQFAKHINRRFLGEQIQKN